MKIFNEKKVNWTVKYRRLVNPNERKLSFVNIRFMEKQK